MPNRSKRPPILRTRKQVEKALVQAMRGILGSGVTVKALKSPSEMDFKDIIINPHLYERLGVAFVAIAALKGYKPDYFPCGYTIEGSN